MIEVSVALDDKPARQLDAVLRNAPQMLQPYLLAGMKRVGLELERHVKGDQLSGQALKTRTGTLRKSVFSRAEATSDGDVIAVIGVDLAKAPYGRVQELGGTIRPVKASVLAIPIGEARTAKGVARFSARDLIANPGAFGYTGAFFRKNVLFGTRSGELVPLFALKSSVTIKPTGYLRQSQEEKRTWVIDEIGRAVGKGLKAIFPNG